MPFVSWLLVANETSSKWDVVKTITIMNHWTTPISSVALASLVLSLGAFAQNRVTSESNYIRTQGDFSETGRLYALLPQAPSQVKAQQDAQTKAEQEKKVEEKEQSERTLGVVPRFGTTDRMDAPPLKTSQKFRLFAKTAFDPVIVAIAAAQAGVSQADNQFKQYGQGAEGYGKRFGAAYADQVSSGFFRNFLYPTIFKQDPRYFRLGHGGFVHRFGYSLAQGVVCHTDSGGRAFNISNVLGAFTSGGLSNV